MFFFSFALYTNKKGTNNLTRPLIRYPCFSATARYLGINCLIAFCSGFKSISQSSHTAFIFVFDFSFEENHLWVVNKRGTINPKNKDHKCFQYSIVVALNHQNIKNHPERISNIGIFIDQYNWEGIDFSGGIKSWKKFGRNNKTIALNILFVPHKREN